MADTNASAPDSAAGYSNVASQSRDHPAFDHAVSAPTITVWPARRNARTAATAWFSLPSRTSTFMLRLMAEQEKCHCPRSEYGRARHVDCSDVRDKDRTQKRRSAT